MYMYTHTQKEGVHNLRGVEGAVLVDGRGQRVAVPQVLWWGSGLEGNHICEPGDHICEPGDQICEPTCGFGETTFVNQLPILFHGCGLIFYWRAAEDHGPPPKPTYPPSFQVPLGELRRFRWGRIPGVMDSGLIGSTDFLFITSTWAWEGFGESRRCSRDTYPESYITEYSLVYEDDSALSRVADYANVGKSLFMYAKILPGESGKDR